jgi:beta-galactosidase/beta-glucuronidase
MPTVERISRELIERPERIYALEKELAHLKFQVQEAKQDMDEIELTYLLDVLNETGPDGKPAHTNETKRQAEVKRRLAENEVYRGLEDRLKTLKYEVEQKEATLHFEWNGYGSVKSIARLIAADAARTADADLDL